MNEGLIPNRYAKALFKFAAGQNEVESVYGETKKLVENYLAEPAIAKAVENPFLSYADKEKVLLAAAEAAPERSLDKFFKLVFSRGRESLICQMALAYGKMYREANGIRQVEITTASALPAKDLDKIKATVQAYLGNGRLEYKECVDAGLIGGFTVKVDSRLLDASISSELRKLRLKLLSKK